ncbi:DUF6193 family natural product biosynthesis protein [Streptomyces sp. NPDC056323]|uniref:DUF6193 family natural product biosynthesis protein n=1 Tax=unclassified Streptomyces TaxID=2593676 RepID=UPI0035DB4F67
METLPIVYRMQDRTFMPEAPDVETAWTWLLERRPMTRGCFDDSLPPIAAAAYAEPVLRTLFPFHTHGTLKFIRDAPPWPEPPTDDLPFVVLGEPPYRVYTAGYATLGEVATAEDAISLLVAHLPADLGADAAGQQP